MNKTATTSDLRIGQIGLGAFGTRIATRLLWSGFHTLQVYDDLDQATRHFCNNYGGTIGVSPSSMAQGCDVVVTVLPSAADLRRACFGWEGLAEGLAPGGVIIDFGQTDPVETLALAKELEARKIHLVDAPAFGAPEQAKEGKLTLIVGGDDAAIARCKPVLETVGSKILRAGASGSAQAASAIVDYMRAVELQATSEALRLGEKFGFEGANLLDIWDALGGGEVDRVLRSEVITRRFKSGLPLGMLRKNLDLASAMAASAEVSVPLLQAARVSWKMAEQKIGWGADHTAIIQWLESIITKKPEPAPSAESASPSVNSPPKAASETI